jgi:cytochrome b subunit of formate dehydrogenase
MKRFLFFPFLILFVIICSSVPAQTIDDCLGCHEDADLTKDQDGLEISLFIDKDKFMASIHGESECIFCHTDLDGVELPHSEELAPADCSGCHDDIAKIYDNSQHGRAVKAGAKLAPQCWDCHGSHYIVPNSSPQSNVDRFNIPFLCGRCHKEGTPVSETYDIHQDSILTHYSLGMHGEGLFKRGLTVTAVCNDCHTSHNVLPYSDPNSSIYKDNVAKTCQKCHGRIEEVHQKVIRGELWEKEPNKVPICVDCHEPHLVRKVFYGEGMADSECLKCHSDRNLKAVRDSGQVSMYVDSVETMSSMHRSTACAQCHTGANPGLHRPCTTVINKVDCSICHSEIVETFANSMHGKLTDRGDQRAPECTTCHGIHDVKGRKDPKSITFPTQVPDLCGRCHGAGGSAVGELADGEVDPITSYLSGIHGKGLKESGLVVTAKCTDCHTAHNILPKDDPKSSVNNANVPGTCANCHEGIFEQFNRSIHSYRANPTDQLLPECVDCHNSHTIIRTDKTGFRSGIMDQCGRCHREVTETYFETFHGKVSKLGFDAAAKCYDCHGSHNIYNINEPKSTLSRQNIVKTCGKCHAGSHRQFAGYLTHATHHDRGKYPILFYTFWFMTILLTGTLVVFGTHTILWLPRSFQMMKKHKEMQKRTRGQLQYRRFSPLQRRLHILVIISFLGLAITGMTLKFSYLGWAQWMSDILGGFESAGYIHRLCALITFFYFGMHIIDIVGKKKKSEKSWFKYITDKESMLPNKTDLKEAIGTLKWFVGLGPRPLYGRWTYWEKFDYFAVFWGIAIIGTSGLMLWFPEFFTLFLPGWVINVATIIHSDEALLAVAFIFTVHFFNTHFRPDRFPMDTVIFSGRISVDELREDRPREYAELVRRGELGRNLTKPMPRQFLRAFRIFGAIALLIGISLILLIIWAEIFGYR